MAVIMKFNIKPNFVLHYELSLCTGQNTILSFLCALPICPVPYFERTYPAKLRIANQYIFNGDPPITKRLKKRNNWHLPLCQSF
jgi:hypothetical protein